MNLNAFLNVLIRYRHNYWELDQLFPQVTVLLALGTLCPIEVTAQKSLAMRESYEAWRP